MRRALVLTAVLGATLAGLGCRHVAGRCDCTADPKDAAPPAVANPYPGVGAPIAGGAPVPTGMPAPQAMPAASAPQAMPGGPAAMPAPR